MAYLTIYTDLAEPTQTFATDEAGEIREALAGRGVDYDRWPLADELAHDAPADAVLAAYAEPIARISAEQGYVLVDVAALHPSEDPAWAETAATARQKFLAEHTHADDEVRFFASGSGIFYLHIGDEVLAVLGERGDLLSVPKGTTHWFDMGDAAGLHRRPVLPRPGRLGRQLHGRPHRRAHPRLRHHRRRSSRRPAERDRLNRRPARCPSSLPFAHAPILGTRAPVQPLSQEHPCHHVDPVA